MIEAIQHIDDEIRRTEQEIEAIQKTQQNVQKNVNRLHDKIQDLKKQKIHLEYESFTGIDTDAKVLEMKIKIVGIDVNHLDNNWLGVTIETKDREEIKKLIGFTDQKGSQTYEGKSYKPVKFKLVLEKIK